MKTFKLLTAAVIVLFLHAYIYAQGCSDAGFCTIDSLKLQGEQTQQIQHPNKFKIGFVYGAAENDISIYGGYLDYSRRIHRKLDLNAKLNFIGQDGNEASSAGLSDLYLSSSYRTENEVIFTAGIKLPVEDGNRSLAGISLPMDYQPSLGTVDLIFGFGFGIENLDLTLALQQPVTRNENRFLPDNFPDDSGFASFNPTNGFRRRGDVLIRVSYPIHFLEKWRLTPSLLPIFHLGEDTYTDADGIERNIEGSAGLTLNANVFIEYSIDTSNKIEFGFGAPISTRESRPDGLTREFVTTLEYKVYL